MSHKKDRTWERLVEAWHGGHKTEIIADVILANISILIGIALAFLLTGCASQASAANAPSGEIGPGALVVAQVNEYAEPDIASAVTRTYHRDDAIIVLSCTWIQDADQYTKQIWLQTKSGYVPALNMELGTYTAIYNIEQCTKVTE